MLSNRPRFRWYALRVGPGLLVVPAVVLGLHRHQWALAIFAAGWALHIVVAALNQRSAFHLGWYVGRTTMVEAMSRAESPDELQRLLLDVGPEPWNV